MPAIELIAAGKLRNDPLLDVFEDYKKRILWKFTLTEIDEKTQGAQIAEIGARIKPGAALIVLDERGKSLPSREFAAKIDGWMQHHPVIQFVIGGADGLSDELRGKATMVLSLGTQTWPHMLARVMLIEQIYRAQQILANHPYHRD